MLTDEKKFENKMQYFELLTELNIDLTALTKYLDSERVDYFNKPYNTYANCAYSGSLCEHSLKVYAELRKLCDLYYPEKYSNEQLIKVALFKDLYRAELYESYTKNVKNETTGQWETQAAYRNKEVRPIFGDISFSSYMIAKKFIDLSDDELVEAICYSGIGSNTVDLHNIRTDYKLVPLVTMAELAVNYLGECKC